MLAIESMLSSMIMPVGQQVSPYNLHEKARPDLVLPSPASPRRVTHPTAAAAAAALHRQFLFADHLRWDMLMAFTIIFGVCGPGGLCAQAAGCARVVNFYGGAFQMLSRGTGILARLLHLAPPDVLPLPGCAASALGLLLPCCLAPTLMLWCVQLNSRSLALQARGVRVLPADMLISACLLQAIPVIVAGGLAYVTLFSMAASSAPSAPPP